MKRSSCHHDNNNKHGDVGGDSYHEPLENETKEEVTLLTAVVVRPINTSQNVDGGVFFANFLISHTFSSSLVVSRSGLS